MSTVDLSGARWRKSSFSGGGGDNESCVEVAFVPAATALRDSKNPGPVLIVPPAGWAGLRAAARAR